MTVEELGAYLSENGENIREQMRTRKYKPQPVRRVEIPKEGGGVRKLGVPTVVDRFTQQAVAQVLTPIFEEQFHENSYGFRPKRCAQQAVLAALEITQFHAKISEYLSDGWAENEADPDNYEAEFERTLLTRIDKYRRNYFLWVEDFSLPTTNNLAERGLRGVKSRMKISGQLESEAAADNHAPYQDIH